MNRREFSKSSLMLGLGFMAGSASGDPARFQGSSGDYYEEPVKKLPTRKFDVVVAGGDADGGVGGAGVQQDDVAGPDAQVMVDVAGHLPFLVVAKPPDNEILRAHARHWRSRNVSKALAHRLVLENPKEMAAKPVPLRADRGISTGERRMNGFLAGRHRATCRTRKKHRAGRETAQQSYPPAHHVCCSIAGEALQLERNVIVTGLELQRSGVNGKVADGKRRQSHRNLQLHRRRHHAQQPHRQQHATEAAQNRQHHRHDLALQPRAAGGTVHEPALPESLEQQASIALRATHLC